jgi:hypothetical protein
VSIYTKLFRYRERPSNSPLENFLTEALADLFNRLSLPLRVEFLDQMLPASCSNRIQNICENVHQIEAVTQVSIDALGSVKRPDIVIYVAGEPRVLFEVKIAAAFQAHRIGISAIEPSIEGETDDVQGEIAASVIQSQLKTYSDWIRSQQSDDWRGAVVLLTHGTRPPIDFENDGRDRSLAIGVTRTWNDVRSWITDNLDYDQLESTQCALGLEFVEFLEERGVITMGMSTWDFAATELFIPSYKALYETFYEVLSYVGQRYPSVKTGNAKFEFWSDGNAYWGYYWLNQSLNPTGSKFYIGIGVCFPHHVTGALNSTEHVGIPTDEPFFFIYIEDTKENAVSALFTNGLPEGWVALFEGYGAVVTRPVRVFEAGADARKQSLIAWVNEEVGRATASIPNFAA